MSGTVLTVGTALTGLMGAAVVLMGIHGLRAPQSAAGFGIPGTPTQDRAFDSWLAVKAVRDIALGLLILLLAAADTTVLGWVVLVAAGIPVGDALIVHRSAGPRAAVWGVHGATAAVMLAISLVLLLA